MLLVFEQAEEVGEVGLNVFVCSVVISHEVWYVCARGSCGVSWDAPPNVSAATRRLWVVARVGYPAPATTWAPAPAARGPSCRRPLFLSAGARTRNNNNLDLSFLFPIETCSQVHHQEPAEGVRLPRHAGPPDPQEVGQHLRPRGARGQREGPAQAEVRQEGTAAASAPVADALPAGVSQVGLLGRTMQQQPILLHDHQLNWTPREDVSSFFGSAGLCR